MQTCGGWSVEELKKELTDLSHCLACGCGTMELTFAQEPLNGKDFLLEVDITPWLFQMAKAHW